MSYAVGKPLGTPNINFIQRQILRLPCFEIAGKSIDMIKTGVHFGFAPFVLQDHKRLPARFFARLSGARTCRIG